MFSVTPSRLLVKDWCARQDYKHEAQFLQSLGLGVTRQGSGSWCYRLALGLARLSGRVSHFWGFKASDLEPLTLTDSKP